MRTFDYEIKDELGIHARPAGLLVKLVKETESIVTIEKGGKRVDATKLFSIMGLGVVKGDVIKVTIEDGNEEATEKSIKDFLENNL